MSDKLLYEKILAHVGHEIEVATYGDPERVNPPVNVSVECMTCSEVIVSEDKDG